jgi:hypothetical protein
MLNEQTKRGAWCTLYYNDISLLCVDIARVGNDFRNELVRPRLFEIACSANIEERELEERPNRPIEVGGIDNATEDFVEEIPW